MLYCEVNRVPLFFMFMEKDWQQKCKNGYFLYHYIKRQYNFETLFKEIENLLNNQFYLDELGRSGRSHHFTKDYIEMVERDLWIQRVVLLRIINIKREEFKKFPFLKFFKDNPENFLVYYLASYIKYKSGRYKGKTNWKTISSFLVLIKFPGSPKLKSNSYSDERAIKSFTDALKDRKKSLLKLINSNRYIGSFVSSSNL